MSAIQTPQNELFAEQIYHKIFAIQDELSEYIKANVSKNINNVYPFASNKIRNDDLFDFTPFQEIFILIFIVINQERFIRDFKEIKTISKSLIKADLI